MILVVFLLKAKIYAVGEAKLEKKTLVIKDYLLKNIFQLFHDKINVQNDGEFYLYKKGDFIYLDKEGQNIYKKNYNVSSLKEIYKIISGEETFIFDENFYGICFNKNIPKEKDIYQWDFLGKLKKITNYKKDLISLNVTQDKIIFSMYTPRIDYYKGKKVFYKKLCLFELMNNYLKELFCHESLQSGARVTPWGLLYTISREGRSQIYLNREPLTEGNFIDVDPVFDEEKNLYFVSSRSGYPMIYKKNIQNQYIQITNTGRGISRPVLLDQYIYFSVLLGNQFEGYRIDKNGYNLEKIFKENIAMEELDVKNDFFIFQHKDKIGLSKKDNPSFFKWNFNSLTCRNPRFRQ